eukprot:2352885-Pleurochrysis_carterae.AAC.1
MSATIDQLELSSPGARPTLCHVLAWQSLCRVSRGSGRDAAVRLFSRDGIDDERAAELHAGVEQIGHQRDGARAVGARLCEQAHLELVEADDLAHADVVRNRDVVVRLVHDVDALGRQSLGQDQQARGSCMVLADDTHCVCDGTMDVGQEEDGARVVQVELLHRDSRDGLRRENIAIDKGHARSPVVARDLGRCEDDNRQRRLARQIGPYLEVVPDEELELVRLDVAHHKHERPVLRYVPDYPRGLRGCLGQRGELRRYPDDADDNEDNVG